MVKDIAKEIKQLALDLGFDDVAIADSDNDIVDSDKINYILNNNLIAPLEYLKTNFKQRKNINILFPSTKSVIIVLKNYYTGDFPESSQKKAKIARYAWGKDYHQWFKKQLTFFEEKVKKLLPAPAMVWHFNDTKPVFERAWAHRAGLGFIGKSTMFISRKLGTYTLIGGLGTDYQLAQDHSYMGPDCGSCQKCIDACPTKAILPNGYMIDGNKCIATWTIEKSLSKEAIQLAPKNHNWGFGCDICQEVCPWNKFKIITNEERFAPIDGRVLFTKETFKQDLRGSPLNRPRKSGLMANFLRIRKTLTEPNLKIINPKN